MSGEDTSSGSTSVTQPLPFQRKAFEKAITAAEGQAFDAAGNLVGQEFFPGQTVADPSANTLESEQLALGQVPGLQQSATAQNATLQGLLDPTSAASQAAIAPFLRQLNEQMIPQIGSRAIQQGAFGGDRQRVQENQAVRGITEGATDAILRQQLNALRTAPSVAQSQLLGAEITGQVGGAETAREQALINAEREKFEFGQESPELALDRLISRISGVNLGQASSGTNTINGQGMSNEQLALGALTGGASLFF